MPAGERRASRERSSRAVRRLALPALVALLFALPAPARQVPQPRPVPRDDEPAIELASNLVTLVLVVRDASGALVTDLEAQEFSVYENGAPQEIDRFFRQDEVPLRLALLVDTSLSVEKRLEFERLAADRFLTTALRPRDQAAVISVSTTPRVVQGLTASLGELAAATATLRAEGVTLLYSAVDLAARALAGAEGRRVILILSDGNDVGSSISAREALESAHRADTVIYAIGTPGVLGLSSPTPLERAGQEALRALCSQTGGTAVFPAPRAGRADERAALDEAFAKLLAEIRAQYVLTYYSATPAARAGFRSLRVEAKRPGLSVLARSGYYGK